MLLIYILVPGLVSLVAGVLAFLFGASVLVAVAVYIVAGFAGSALCMIVGMLDSKVERSGNELNQQIELELIALRESIREDTRMRAGSPVCLTPVLYRKLMAREAWLERGIARETEPSAYVVKVPGVRGA